MRLYAEAPAFRLRQMLTDAAFALWVIFSVAVGYWVHRLVSRLAAPARDIRDAGRTLARSLQGVSDRVADAPLVGAILKAPFEAAAESGRALERAGASQQDMVQALALWLGLILALAPIAYLSFRYLPQRIRWIRDASAVSRFPLDEAHLHLLALRAIANRPLHELSRAVGDPAGAYSAGDYRPLAAIELAALGLRADPASHQLTGPGP